MPASARHTGQPESYYHGEGRVALTGSEPRFQYKLTDHLGNTMVLFEDINGDGIITTESMNSNDPVEVLQRNFYYAFGLPMQGPWNHAPADPDMPYLYNGKELEGELRWYAYGFRYYDASIGRFAGVDPLAGQMPDWSPFGYAYSNPISFIDFMGLAPEAPLDDYYDQNGNFLYRDNQVTDNIRIINSSDWGIIEAVYKDQILDGTGSSLGLMQALEEKSTIVNEATLTAQAWSNITTHILSSMDDVDVSKLHNGRVSVLNYNTPGAEAKFNDPTNFGSLANVDPKTLRETGAVNLTVYLWSGTPDSELRTVSNVENTLGAHEFLGHGIKGYSDRSNSHHRAYELQMNHPSWNGTTSDFKQSQLEKYNEYKLRERQ